MGKSKIQWTQCTWNPVSGCTKYSAGCANCYAETMTRRLKAMGQEKYKDGFNKVVCHPDALDEPRKVKNPSCFFICSMADLFHKDVPFEFVDRVMYTIANTPQHTYQILSKRSDRLSAYCNWMPIPKNAWIGVTVEAEQYKNRIDDLREVKNFNPDNVTFLSCEPLLSDLGELNLDGIDWVIVGGESGPNARPMKKEWVLNIQRQCKEQGAAFFFKQWGTWGQDGVKRNKKDNGNFINGKQYMEYPASYTISKKQ